LDITPEQQLQEEEPVRAGWRRRRVSGNLIRRIVQIAIALVVLPYLLIFVYALPFTRPVSTLMLSELALFRGYDRRWVSLEEISPNLVQIGDDVRGRAVLRPWGRRLERRCAASSRMRSTARQTRGASTIPMQTAKNLFLWNGRSFVRKGDGTAPRDSRRRPRLSQAAPDGDLSERRRVGRLASTGSEAAARHHFKRFGGEAFAPPGRASRRGAAQPDRPALASRPSRGVACGVWLRCRRAPGARIRRLHQMHL
jgi:monofunctional biosynthetic peptidoglycan transglycosylase